MGTWRNDKGIFCVVCCFGCGIGFCGRNLCYGFAALIRLNLKILVPAQINDIEAIGLCQTKKSQHTQ
jgi:hypothetical protein